MKPHVIWLMASSVDGRTLRSRWRPKGPGADLFERVHDELAGDAWLVGRVTGREFAKGKPYPASTKETFPREPWFARRERPVASCSTRMARSAGAVRTSAAIRSSSSFPRRYRMRTWRGYAARACARSSPEGRNSISPSRLTSSIANSA